MEIQIGKMILNAILYAVLYLVAPLIVLYLLDYYGIFSVSQYLITGIIIFGIIGVIIAVLKSAYPEESAKNRVIMFLITIYSGIYLFYIFGGFEPGVELGNFSISTQQLEIGLGLKFIAWLMLAVAGVRSLQYLFEAFELRGVTKDSVKYKKRAKPSLLFKIIGILISIGFAIYLISLIGSGLMIRPSLVGTPSAFIDDQGTPGDLTDDTINLSITYDLSNGGIYSLRNLKLKTEIWVLSSENETALPPGAKIGESSENLYSEIPPFSEVTNEELTAVISNTYTSAYLKYNASLSLHIMFDTLFGGISANVTLKLPI